MSDSVRWLVNVPDSFKTDSVPWNGGNRPEFESNLSPDIPASREAGGTIILLTDCESDERRWWKLPARVGLPELAIIEMFVAVLFLLIAAVAIISCFVELTQLLESDALGRVVAKAMEGGA